MQVRPQSADPVGWRFWRRTLADGRHRPRGEYPKKFLEQILLDLKHAGYVRSKQGTKGGYRLVRDPRQITLAEIYRLFDGAIALVPCVSQKFYETCDDVPTRKLVASRGCSSTFVNRPTNYSRELRLNPSWTVLKSLSSRLKASPNSIGIFSIQVLDKTDRFAYLSIYRVSR